LTLLQALDRHYDRISRPDEGEHPSFTREKISFAIMLSAEGEAIAVTDLRIHGRRRLSPRLMPVPAAVRRTVGIAPNFLWDKSAYVLGCTARPAKRSRQEHAAFRSMHLDALAGTVDPGLVAVRRFIERWQRADFKAPPFVSDMLDTNIVFRMEGTEGFIHESEAARDLLARRLDAKGSVATCLATGVPAPIARLHPAIKGVAGAQPSGAALVSSISRPSHPTVASRGRMRRSPKQPHRATALRSITCSSHLAGIA
jgi:CRISPR-associated protein Csd1